MKRKTAVILLTIATVCTLSFIFYNSSQRTAVSNARSAEITKCICKVFGVKTTDTDSTSQKNNDSKGTSGQQSSDKTVSQSATEETTDANTAQTASANRTIDLGKLNSVVRKTAHALEYMLLGSELYILKILITKKALSWSLFAPLFCSLSAATADEYIQFFAERTSRISDVLVDFAGSIIGMTIVLAVFGMVKLVKYEKHHRSVK